MRLPCSVVAAASGVAMVLPMVCHGPPYETYATLWDAVGVLWYAMVVPWPCHKNVN